MPMRVSPMSAKCRNSDRLTVLVAAPTGLPIREASCAPRAKARTFAERHDTLDSTRPDFPRLGLVFLDLCEFLDITRLRINGHFEGRGRHDPTVQPLGQWW